MLLAVVLPAIAQQPPSKRGRPIRFSEPRSDVVSSNVNQLRTSQTSLQELEQSFKKPFELLSPSDDPVVRLTVPPLRHFPPSAARSRQMKELLEKRNEWVFLEPEDYYDLGLTAEEMLNVPEYGADGEVKKRKTPLERYYDNMDKARAAAQAAITNRARGEETPGTRLVDEETERLNEPRFTRQSDSLKRGSGEVERPFEPLSTVELPAFTQTGSEPSLARDFSELFGFGKSEAAQLETEKARNLEARSQEFKQLLEMRSASTLNPGAGTLNSWISRPLGTPPALAAGGLDALSGTSAGSSSPLANNPAPNPGSLSPPALQPGAAANSGLPNWRATLPAPEPSRKGLPAPAFQIPQRKF